MRLNDRTTVLPAPSGWPSPPDRAVWQGLAGEIAQAVAPHTEGDPIAVLAQLVVGAGAVIGRKAWMEVEQTRHYPNEFLVLVGASASRKGASWSQVQKLLTRVEPRFDALARTGLKTGEGLIQAARERQDADPSDVGPTLLFHEPEFVALLRDLGTLSTVLRNAWDGRPLELMTKNAPVRATNAHIAFVGHITPDELTQYVRAVEIANGLLNRFLFVACRRHRILPDGGKSDPLEGTGLEKRLKENFAKSRYPKQLYFDDTAASNKWRDIYHTIAEEDENGLVGLLRGRAEAHVRRLAMIFALIDGRETISVVHLEAAFALWQYASESVDWAMRSATGDPIAERIHCALAAGSSGLDRTAIRDLFQRNKSKTAVDQALVRLVQDGRAYKVMEPSGGRPREVWFASDRSVDEKASAVASA